MINLQPKPRKNLVFLLLIAYIYAPKKGKIKKLQKASLLLYPLVALNIISTAALPKSTLNEDKKINFK